MAAFILVGSANAGLITYDTNGADTYLSCGTASGCTQESPDSILIGGITLTYEPIVVSTSDNVSPPSNTGLGDIDATGSGTDVSFVGAYLVIGIDDTSLLPTASGDMPEGTFTGTISTDSSIMEINFLSGDVTTPEGTLPGVAITSGTTTDTFQVLNVQEGINSAAEPATSLQGFVSENESGGAPEPATMAMVGGLLVGLGALARRRRRA